MGHCDDSEDDRDHVLRVNEGKKPENENGQVKSARINQGPFNEGKVEGEYWSKRERSI